MKVTSKIGLGAQEAARQEATGGVYAGPTPPKGVYRGRLRFFAWRTKDGKVQYNRNGDPMVRGAVQIAETGSKAKYNGYLINFQQNYSEQGVPWINQMLNAISGGDESYRVEFWKVSATNGVGFGSDEKGNIVKIGRKRYEDNKVEVVVSAKDDPDQDGNRRLTVAGWLVPQAASEPDDDEDGEDEDIDVEPVEEGDEDDEETDDEFQDDDDEEETDDDEDETDEDEEDEDGGEEDPDDAADPSELRLEELKKLDRKALVAIAKPLGIKAVKSKTDNTYIEEILAAEFPAAESAEATDDDEDDEPPF